MLLTDIDEDSVLNIIRKTDAPTWNRLMQVSVGVRVTTRKMLENLVTRLSIRFARVFNVKHTIQAEALLHFFLETSVRAAHQRLPRGNREVVEKLLKDHLEKSFP